MPVSGPYTATWNGLSLGTQDDNGFILRGTYQAQEVNASDAYGMTLVEAIHRGINWRLAFKGLEFNRPGILAAIQAFGSLAVSSSALTPTLRSIGNRYSAYAQPLVLMSILAYPPTMPQSLTALSAIVAPQLNVEYMMTSKVREAPFEMVLLPYKPSPGTTYAVSFTTT